MSLRIWLPLTKDLRNQGLDDVTVTNNGATFDANGKLGGCYSFVNGYLNLPSSLMSNFKECSICFWININSWNASYETYFHAGKNSYSWTDYIFGILRNAANSTVCFTIGNGSTASNSNYLTSAWSVGEWMHVAFIYSAGKCKIYLNGNIDKEYDTSIVPDFTKITKITIGHSNGSAYQTNCKMNDFRIYDHALSSLEVKEISQGLVLHYPLSDKYLEDTTNLVTSISAGGQTTVNNNIVTTSGVDKDTYFTINLSEDIVVGTQYTFTCDAEIPSGTWRFPLGNQNNTTLDFVLHNGHNVYSFVANDTSWGTKRLFMDDNGGTTNSARSTGLQTKIYNFQLEKKDHETGFAGYGVSKTNSIVYDTSGYGNNGTPIGSFSVDKNTPKYNVSTVFNGVDNCIQIGNWYTLFQNPFTINVWFKKDEIGSKSYETLFGGASGFEIDTRTGNSQALSLYLPSPRGVAAYSPFNFSQWYMVTMVNNGTNEEYYVDGILKKTIEKKTMTNSMYRIGAWNSDTSQNFKGQMSDFRVYATALSADDVKSLYNNSAYIDNQGNIYGAVYEEV